MRCTSSSIINAISESLVNMRQRLPKEFSRKPRSLTEVSHWKATELPLFLLYTGLVVLFGQIPQKMYHNFMLLSVSMRILLSPNLCANYSNYVQELLLLFVMNVAKIYGKEMIIHNSHNLIHIVEDAKKYGHTYNISCLPFENFLGKLKKMVRCPQNPVAQIVRRISEKSLAEQGSQRNVHENPYRKPHFAGPLPAPYLTCHQYKQYRSPAYVITCLKGDNCFEVGGQVMIVRNIFCTVDQEPHIVYDIFEKMESIFQYPLDSSCL